MSQCISIPIMRDALALVSTVQRPSIFFANHALCCICHYGSCLNFLLEVFGVLGIINLANEYGHGGVISESNQYLSIEYEY